MTQTRAAGTDSIADARGELTARFEAEVTPLFDQLQRAAYRYTHNSDDAKDLVQETLARAWAGYTTFTPGTNMRAWLFRILNNTAISRYRRAERRPLELLVDGFTDQQLAAEAHHTSIGLPSAESSALADAADEPVIHALEALSDPLRTVVCYADIDGYKYHEIAALLDIPVGTVMSRIHRARRKLRASLAAAEAGRASA
jgi:RNA polymerase sigma-70 factor, ECF subfamily